MGLRERGVTGTARSQVLEIVRALSAAFAPLGL
jgi:hypothetical protein